MVVNKKKGVKIPSKAVKKSAGAKTKVIRDKKNTTVDIRGAAKRNKTIKPKKSSQLSTPNKNRTSAEKNKRASNNTSPKILKGDLKEKSVITKSTKKSPKKPASPPKAKKSRKIIKK